MNTLKWGFKVRCCIVLLLLLATGLVYADTTTSNCTSCGDAFWSPPVSQTKIPPLDKLNNPIWEKWNDLKPEQEFNIGSKTDIGKLISFGLKNEHDPDNYKLVWLDIKPGYMILENGQELNTSKEVFEYINDPKNMFYYWGSYGNLEDDQLNDYKLSVSLIENDYIRFEGRIAPCPDFEWVTLYAYGVKDFHFAVVDFNANCVPEPATMSLVGLGLAGLAVRKYRQRKIG